MPPTEHSAGPLLTDHLRYWAANRPRHRAVTFVDFTGPASPGRHHSLDWQGLDDRARAVAARLAGVARPGERAALLLPQGIDYVAAFLGCLYAGVIAVPLFAPGLPGHEGRLAAVLEDCEAACVLSDAATAPAVAAFTDARGLPPLPVVRADGPPTAPDPDTAPPAPPAPDDIAYLQYTSGSTRSPAGVMITHANVVANARQAIAAFGAEADAHTTVGWLPLFHDMGLVLSVAAPVVGGFPSVLMDPVAFLEEPVRWLRLLGGYPGTISAAPNFAYDYCATRTDPDEAAELRLDRVKVLINGSEPVRAGTVDRFREAFAVAGLAPEAHCPAYGLAEATVFATADSPATPPATVHCDPDALAEGRVEVPGPADATSGESARPAQLVCCGGPVGQELRITDPVTGAPRAAGEIGEIRLRGPNIGRGYWKRAELSAETFQVATGDAGAADGGGGWLRTGDLGALYGGRLLVTGRLKDLIIVDGRNHYPQDIEETVQSAVHLVRRDRLTAFCVPGPDASGEELVVVAEYRKGAEPSAEAAAAAAGTARAALSTGHGLRLGALRLVPPGSIPRTTSGKVARAASRARWVGGGFDGPAESASDDTGAAAEAIGEDAEARR